MHNVLEAPVPVNSQSIAMCPWSTDSRASAGEEDPESPALYQSIRVVKKDTVHPHERNEQARTNGLKERVLQDGALKNPPLVVRLRSGAFLLLDGANRMQVIRELGLNHVPVQVVQPTGVRLGAWAHVTQTSWHTVYREFCGPNVEMDTISVSEAEAALSEGRIDAFAVDLRDGVPQALVFYSGHTPDLNPIATRITDIYMRAETIRIARTIYAPGALPGIRSDYPDRNCVFVFRPYRMDELMAVTEAGQVVPSGLTRFVIPGRILNLNVSLEFLADHSRAVHLKTQDLQRTMRSRGGALHTNYNERETDGIRCYEEPVYVLQ